MERLDQAATLRLAVCLLVLVALAALPWVIAPSGSASGVEQGNAPAFTDRVDNLTDNAATSPRPRP